MSSAGLAPRRAAQELLLGVLRDQQMISELVEGDGPLSDLPGPERAHAQSLALGVLRNLASLDAVITPHVERLPPLPVLIALRIAAHEALIEKVPPHAAVSAAVDLVSARPNSKRLAGLANAVARKVVAHEGTLAPPALPGWLSSIVKKAYGREAADQMAAVQSKTPPLDITPRNPAKTEALAEKLDAELLPTGSLRLARQGQITALPGYSEGQWWVQDAAAALPVRMLGDISGLNVLDLCAAPGGKTMQLAAAGADVTALDISGPRMARVEENLTRTGLTAKRVVVDALHWKPEAAFDLILLDAPCSATGTIRRHPDLPHARPSPDLRPLLELQSKLIDAALGWLKPGGRLLYCTCSLFPKEGERQISQALERHEGLTILPFMAENGVEPAFLTPTGALRLRPDFWPERGGMDGFFATLLQKA